MTVRSGVVWALLLGAGLVLAGEHVHELRAWLRDRKLARAMARKEATLPTTWAPQNGRRLGLALAKQRKERNP